MSDALAPLAGALSRGEPPPFEWTVEYPDDAAIARAWHHAGLVTQVVVLDQLRRHRGRAWLIAAVATACAPSVRRAGGWESSAPWARAAADLLRRAAVDPYAMDLEPEIKRLDLDPHGSTSGTSALSAVQSAFQSLINIRGRSATKDAAFRAAFRCLPKGLTPRAVAWLAEHAPPPTYAEIFARTPT